MGFLQSVGNVVFGPGKMVGEALFGKKGENDLPNEAANAPVDTRLMDLTTQSVQDAQNYQNSLPQRKLAQQQLAEGMARRQADSGVKDVQTAANKRGLLYSGLRQADEAGVRAQAASGLANQTNQINAQEESTAQNMSNAAIQNSALMQQLIANQKAQSNQLAANQDSGGGLPLMPLNKLSNW